MVGPSPWLEILINRGGNCVTYVCVSPLDIKSMSLIVPVHPEDQSLLGINWQRKVSMDTRLLLGLRLVPIIFRTVANALI